MQKTSINIVRDIQINTVSQAQGPTLFEERKLRLTALYFEKYFVRKQESTEPFLKSIFEAKHLSNVASIRHGQQNEKVAIDLTMQRKFRSTWITTLQYMTLVLWHPSPLPYPGASTDGKQGNGLLW